MKKIIRKVLKITGIVLLVLIAAAFIIPIAFKKQITNLVKKEINKSLTATVDFKDVSISLFRHFPKVSIGLENLSVVGSGEFVKDTLVSADNIDVSANLISVIKGKDIQVSGIFLESPRIHALVTKEGKANWDITRPSTDTTASSDTSASAFKMSLSKYEINNGYIYYEDKTADMSAEISGLNHSGSGDFTQDIFTLSTKTKADAVSFNYAGIPYLAQTQTGIGADLTIDNKTSKYSFKTDDINVNNLKLSADGFFQLVNDSTYNMDINFKSPSNDFKDILSLVPAVYKNDFDKIKTSGSAAFNGFVKGTYSPVQLPAYDVNLEVKDGFFQYPDLPKPVKNIQLSLQASNKDGQMDNTVVNLSKGHLEMGSDPFDFRFIFKNPETAKYIDAAAKGKLDLSQVTQFVKLEGNTKLAGLIGADIFAKGNMSALQTQTGDFTAGGFLDIQKLFYSSNAFPQPIQNGNIKLQVANSGGAADNTEVNITSGHIEVGKDPVDFTLQLKKPMSSIDFNGTAKGSFTLDNVKQFVQLEPGTSVTGILDAALSFTGNKTAIDKGEYDKINLAGTTSLNKFRFVSKDYPGGVAISNTQLTFNPKTVSLTNLAGSYMNSNFTANGVLNNLIGYALKNEPLQGTVNVSVDKMNLNDWMGTVADTTTASSAAATNSEPFLVPSGLDLVLNAKAGQVTYDNVNYNNINGTLALADETVKLQNVQANALEGTMNFNGSYSTKVNKKDPAISLAYDVKDIDIQKAFLSFVTVKKLMPIGQFLAGKLSSQLSVTGNLNGQMMPELSSLTGKGTLLLLEDALKKFAPLEKIANTLQIQELQSITLKDIKNSIEFANGKVLVKPFTVKVKDIEMQIGGTHSFDQSIDYIVAMKVPRKYLGTQGNNLINGLVTQANNKGLNVKMSELIDLNIKMGGSLTNPTIKTDLKEVAGDAVADLKQQAQDFAQQKIDSAKQTLKDTLTTVKNQVLTDVKEELKNKLLGNKDSTQKATNLDSTKKNAEKTIKNTLNNLLKKKKEGQ
ncbi:MAG: hypothetical protein DI535_25490 [Citrobacter freundii]|nr:MAG: hypothetical protein DI535_25490 [Citrobacter freundii]